jgi:hypothetical protein
MEVVVASIIYNKSHALNHRQFREYLADLFSDYEDVSFYCEVRWLSKGQMLKLFYDLRQDIADFMDKKAFLVDATGYLNKLNLKLQKQGQLVHELH